MDYKYIEQLLERYFKCETTLEEENILRAFFSQKDVPASLAQWQPLFAYEQQEVSDDVLGDDFDEKVMAQINSRTTVKARVIPMSRRLMPLFRAAAVVAIFLTLGNAMQVMFQEEPQQPTANVATVAHTQEGPSVAKADTAHIDSLVQGAPQTAIIK